MKKYGEDQGGNLAALVTYYGFLSLFPLLLVALTVLGYVLHANPGLQHDLVNSVLRDFPIIGSQISENVQSLHGSLPALALGLVATLYGGLGVARAAQDAMNRIWGVPRAERPAFVPRLLRSLEMVGLIGVGAIATTGLSAIASSTAALGPAGRVLLIAGATASNVGLFLVLFNVSTVAETTWRMHVPGAIVAGVLWEVLQSFGGLYVAHSLRGMTQTYGFFAIVIGLLAWIYLEAQVVLLSAEINVVHHRHLWPRSLAG